MRLDAIHAKSELDTQGFKASPRSWPEVMALVSVVLLAVSGLSWGLKLETKIDQRQQENAEIMVLIRSGILPVTREKIDSINQRLDSLERKLDALNNSNSTGFRHPVWRKVD